MYLGNGLSILETAKICANDVDLQEMAQICGEMA